MLFVSTIPYPFGMKILHYGMQYAFIHGQ